MRAKVITLDPLRKAFGVARSLNADRVAADITRAFEDAGIRGILLKGATVAAWLYDDPAERPYVDSDLLVSPAHVDAAEDVLSKLGFVHPPLDDIPFDRPWHAHAWVHPIHGGSVDLHRTLIGVAVPPDETWRVLSKQTVSFEVGGARVEALNSNARCMHVALHAAQDGIRKSSSPGGRPLRDLERALELLPLETWQAAVRIAEELRAVPAFAAGLRLTPAGRDIADRLRLPDVATTEIVLRAMGAPQIAMGLDWLVSTPGIVPKLRVVMRKLFPPVSFMRSWNHLARKGWWGLIAAYVWRPVWLVGQVGPGLRAIWRARNSRPDVPSQESEPFAD